MKILYLSNSEIPSRTANSVHVMKMCHAMGNIGNVVVLIAPQKNKSKDSVQSIHEYYGVKENFSIKFMIYPMWLKGRDYIYSFIAALYCSIQRKDVVYSRNIIGAYFLCLLRQKYIYESHGLDYESDSLIKRVMINKVLKSSRLVRLIVISSYLKKAYANRYTAIAGKIIIAHDGADPIMTGVKNVIKKEKKLLVGYVGHMYRGRGIDLIYEVAQCTPFIDYHLVGGMTEDIDYWRNKVQNSHNVTIHGFVPNKFIPQYLMSFDVLVAPYQNEVSVAGGGGNTVEWMSPLKIFEYMSTGKILVVSRLKALQEILVEDVNCLMADPISVVEWTEKLSLLAEKHESYKQLGYNSKALFEAKYTSDIRARNVLTSVII